MPWEAWNGGGRGLESSVWQRLSVSLIMWVVKVKVRNEIVDDIDSTKFSSGGVWPGWAEFQLSGGVDWDFEVVRVDRRRILHIVDSGGCRRRRRFISFMLGAIADRLILRLKCEN